MSTDTTFLDPSQRPRQVASARPTSAKPERLDFREAFLRHPKIHAFSLYGGFGRNPGTTDHADDTISLDDELRQEVKQLKLRVHGPHSPLRRSALRDVWERPSTAPSPAQQPPPSPRDVQGRRIDAMVVAEVRCFDEGSASESVKRRRRVLKWAATQHQPSLRRLPGAQAQRWLQVCTSPACAPRLHISAHSVPLLQLTATLEEREEAIMQRERDRAEELAVMVAQRQQAAERQREAAQDEAWERELQAFSSEQEEQRVEGRLLRSAPRRLEARRASPA